MKLPALNYDDRQNSVADLSPTIHVSATIELYHISLTHLTIVLIQPAYSVCIALNSQALHSIVSS